MAKGNNILVSERPKGQKLEGTIAVGVTPKPGVVMEIDWSVAKDGNGRFTWEPFGTTAQDSANLGVGADGDRRLIAVLLPDELQGRAATVAYAAGEHCFMYVPAAGEELNMLVEDIGGTGDDIVLGDLFMVDDGTGKLLFADADAEAVPFQSLEPIVNPTADTLLHCRYTGY